MAGTDLGVTQDGAILRLTLNRPGAGNALTGSMTTELVRILEETADSDEVRVVVLTAEGKDFCTGVDLREANAPRSGEKPRAGHFQRRIASGANRLMRALFELQLPVVAGVRGLAAGIGNTLALSADYVVASRTACFWAPYVTKGFTPDSGSSCTGRFPSSVGAPVRSRSALEERNRSRGVFLLPRGRNY